MARVLRLHWHSLESHNFSIYTKLRATGGRTSREHLPSSCRAHSPGNYRELAPAVNSCRKSRGFVLERLDRITREHDGLSTIAGCSLWDVKAKRCIRSFVVGYSAFAILLDSTIDLSIAELCELNFFRLLPDH
jgi:hypothetical protein